MTKPLTTQPTPEVLRSAGLDTAHGWCTLHKQEFTGIVCPQCAYASARAAKALRELKEERPRATVDEDEIVGGADEPRHDRASTLPTDAKARKGVPVFSGFLAYFPDAVAAVAELSRIGNDQHNPGKPLFWDRSKSQDELDALARHLIEAGTIDTDGVRHSAKVAWRAMANLQKEIERERR